VRRLLRAAGAAAGDEESGEAGPVVTARVRPRPLEPSFGDTLLLQAPTVGGLSCGGAGVFPRVRHGAFVRSR